MELSDSSNIELLLPSKEIDCLSKGLLGPGGLDPRHGFAFHDLETPGAFSQILALLESHSQLIEIAGHFFVPAERAFHKLLHLPENRIDNAFYDMQVLLCADVPAAHDLEYDRPAALAKREQSLDGQVLDRPEVLGLV